MIPSHAMEASPLIFKLQVSMGRLWIVWNGIPNVNRVKAGRLMRVRAGQ
jgi:hypothetical protein